MFEVIARPINALSLHRHGAEDEQVEPDDRMRCVGLVGQKAVKPASDTHAGQHPSSEEEEERHLADLSLTESRDDRDKRRKQWTDGPHRENALVCLVRERFLRNDFGGRLLLKRVAHKEHEQLKNVPH